MLAGASRRSAHSRVSTTTDHVTSGQWSVDDRQWRIEKGSGRCALSGGAGVEPESLRWGSVGAKPPEAKVSMHST